MIYWTEAAIGGVLWEKVFLEILQNSRKNTRARVSFLIKLQASGDWATASDWNTNPTATLGP